MADEDVIAVALEARFGWWDIVRSCGGSVCMVEDKPVEKDEDAEGKDHFVATGP